MEYTRPPLVERPLDAVIQQYGNETITARQACAGVVVIGASGSGKSSSVIDSYALGLMSASPLMGGVITHAKLTDRKETEERIAYCGRKDDTIYIDATKQFRINFLEHHRKQTPKGTSQAVCVAEGIDVIAQLQHGNVREEEAYWKSHKLKFNIAACTVIICAGDTLSFKKLVDVCNSMPRSREDLSSDDFLSKSICMHYIDRALKNKEPHNENLDMALSYLIDQMINLDARTRSNVVSTILSNLHTLTTGLLSEILDADTNFTPECTFDGKILILDFPPSVYFSEGNILIGAIHYLWMRDVMRRDLTVNNRCVFSIVDECQLTVNSYMIHFSSVCRSQQALTVYATQSTASIEVKLNSTHSRKMLEQWFGNLATKYFLCSTEVSTINYYVSTIGKDDETRVSYNAGMNHDSNSASTRLEYRNIIPEKEFRLLRTGGPKHLHIVDVIMVSQGLYFNDDDSYLRIEFPQRLAE